MASKRKTPDKLARAAIRNPVAANPLLGKGGEHKDVRAERKQSRAKARRAMQAMRRQLQQSSNGKGEGSWQSSSNVLATFSGTVLPAAFTGTGVLVWAGWQPVYTGSRVSYLP